MKNLKSIFFAFFPIVIGFSSVCAFKAKADLPLPMSNGDTSCWSKLTEIQEALLTSDSILLIGFVLWIAYIVFCFPKNTLKKL